MYTSSEHRSTTLNRVAPGKRFAAFLIDMIVAGIAGGIVGWFFHPLGGLVSATFLLLRDGLELEYMDRRSFGKHVMGLRIVRSNGRPMDIESSIKRNWMFALAGLSTALPGFLSFGIPLTSIGAVVCLYEIYRVLKSPDGRRLGDNLADTDIVEER